MSQPGADQSTQDAIKQNDLENSRKLKSSLTLQNKMITEKLEMQKIQEEQETLNSRPSKPSTLPNSNPSLESNPKVGSKRSKDFPPRLLATHE